MDRTSWLEAENAALRARVAEQDAEIAALRAQVADLAARLDQNPRNSSKPPSSEGYTMTHPGFGGGSVHWIPTGWLVSVW